MIERLEKVLARYNELEELLISQEIVSDIKKLTKLSKEKSSLEETVNLYKEYKYSLQTIEEDKTLLKEEEIKDIAKEEIA